MLSKWFHRHDWRKVNITDPHREGICIETRVTEQCNCGYNRILLFNVTKHPLRIEVVTLAQWKNSDFDILAEKTGVKTNGA